MKEATMEAAAFVRNFVARRARRSLRDVDEDLDLFATGLLDSLGLLELVSAIEQRFGVAIDFADLDLDQFSRISDFAALVTRPTRAGSDMSP